MADSLVSELAEYQQGFRQNRELARHVCSNLHAEAFNWRPADGRWSIAEYLTHLNIAATLVSDVTRRIVDEARAAGRVSPGPFRYGVVSRIMLWSLDPGNRRRFKAPSKFVPPATTYDVEPVLEAFVGLQETWEDCLHAADGLDLARIKVPSPAIGLLRFPLGATFAIQVTHERRHLHQAREVTALPGFPGVPVEDF